MASHRVAANLLMAIIAIGGLLAALSVKQEVFPEMPQDVVQVSLPYPGASPTDVEQGVILVVEEAVRGIDGVKRVTSSAFEGGGTVSAELLLDADPDRVLSDIKNQVNRIQSFPLEAEKPTVSIGQNRREVISLVISGDQDLRTLHSIAEQARSELLNGGEVTLVEVNGVRPLEVSIEVSREALESYDLTLGQVANQVRAASVELPGGRVDTSEGQLLVRVSDRRLRASEFENIIVRGTAQGHEVRLGDVARVTDGYADTDQAVYYNGKRAVFVTALRTGDETPTGVADAVKAYAKVLEENVPANITISISRDDSEMLRGRIDLLSRNAMGGLILVLLTLGLFLHRRLAFWVAVGIPVSFLGAFLAMGPFDASINMVTLFAFILTLGMVVDDAIVVGENIYEKIESGMGRMQAAIVGAREMAVPVTFSILTTVAAFAPLFFIPGFMGKIFKLIPVVVISVLAVSLIESFFILPAHLGHGKNGKFFLPRSVRRILAKLTGPIDRLQAAVSRGLDRFGKNIYRPLLAFVVQWRHLTLAVGIATLILVGGAVKSGLVPFTFFPSIEGDYVQAAARLPFGAPLERTEAVGEALQRAADQVAEESGVTGLVRGLYKTVGEGPVGRGPHGGNTPTGSHLATIDVQLLPSDERELSSEDFAQRWREALPPLPGVEALTIIGRGGPSAGKVVDLQLTHRDTAVLADASADLENQLRGFPTLTNVENTYAAGMPQLDFALRSEASAVGLTSHELARSLRASFFGAEVLREQRGRNEVKVMVRLPEEERRSEGDIESLLVATPTGGYVPVSYVADVHRGRAPSEIKREEGQRVVNVGAGLAQSGASPQKILETVRGSVLPALKAKYPGLGVSFVGQQREQLETMGALSKGFGMALFAIFALLAIPFRSYAQPLIVMSAIPFGVVGAVIGHVILGYPVSMISVLGIIALSGVVVNDSLVLIDSVNRFRREEGMSAYDAVLLGGVRRLRPILLTSLTTFFGLLPMMFETSMQARFLIPMAISLGFGALFVTAIVLLLVPALYVLVDDVAAFIGRLSKSDVVPEAAPVTARSGELPPAPASGGAAT